MQKFKMAAKNTAIKQVWWGFLQEKHQIWQNATSQYVGLALIGLTDGKRSESPIYSATQ